VSPAEEGHVERSEDQVETEVRQRFLAEFRDAVSVRTVLLVVGVLLLQLGFILSYVGAFLPA
jgi:maltodextrin utilization protein YvdJ